MPHLLYWAPCGASQWSASTDRAGPLGQPKTRPAAKQEARAQQKTRPATSLIVPFHWQVGICGRGWGGGPMDAGGEQAGSRRGYAARTQHSMHGITSRGRGAWQPGVPEGCPTPPALPSSARTMTEVRPLRNGLASQQTRPCRGEQAWGVHRGVRCERCRLGWSHALLQQPAPARPDRPPSGLPPRRHAPCRSCGSGRRARPSPQGTFSDIRRPTRRQCCAHRCLASSLARGCRCSRSRSGPAGRPGRQGASRPGRLMAAGWQALPRPAPQARAAACGRFVPPVGGSPRCTWSAPWCGTEHTWSLRGWAQGRRCMRVGGARHRARAATPNHSSAARCGMAQGMRRAPCTRGLPLPAPPLPRLPAPRPAEHPPWPFLRVSAMASSREICMLFRVLGSGCEHRRGWEVARARSWRSGATPARATPARARHLACRRCASLPLPASFSPASCRACRCQGCW